MKSSLLIPHTPQPIINTPSKINYTRHITLHSPRTTTPAHHLLSRTSCVTYTNRHSLNTHLYNRHNKIEEAHYNSGFLNKVHWLITIV